MILGDYLSASLRKVWQPGVFDCCFFPIEWAVTWGRGDPGAKWRGRYSTDLGGLRFIKRAGGLDRLWAEGLLSIGIAEVDDLKAGDVGIVTALGEHGAEQVGAIWTGTKWAMAAQRGLFFGPAACVRAWGPRDG